MAKDSHNLARSFETEEAGGVLTGFLAEEDPFDRRSLWRLGSWGVGAVGAVVVAVLANQSSIGWRREQIAGVDLARQSQQIQSIAREGQNETRRLASAVETLNGDRDRLYSRITVLEQGLDSVTGSIARQNAAAAPPQASPQPSPVASSSPVSSPTSSSTLSSAPAASSTTAFVGPPSPAMSTSPAKADPPVTQTAAPAVAPVATAAPAKAATPPDKQPSVTATSESAPAAVTSAGQTASSAPAATPATPLMPAKSIMGPPDPAAGKPAGSDAPPDAVAAAAAPVVVAAAAAADDARADAAPAAATVQRTEFAVDIGTANSVGGLRALWRGLLKSKANSALAALHPIIMVKEGNTGLGMQLRLAAGPLSDAAAAAKICAALIEGKRTTCETTVFDGQQLAMKDDEPAASAKAAAVRPASHRRTIAKPRVMVEEPPKPQPTALSSFFGR